MNLKEKIIHESLKLFSLKGLFSTSIHDILAAANTSKGGFYNHFSSKDDLFFHVLDEARKIWREKNLKGLDEIENSTEKIKRLLKNYKDRYLKDADNFPGGCVFITLSAELNDQRPQLSKELEKITEILFSGMLGASLVYGVNKSKTNLDKSINSLIEYLEQQKK
jgi:AcrR family transcriptional regulator